MKRVGFFGLWWLGILTAPWVWAQECDTSRYDNMPRERFIIHQGDPTRVSDRVTGLQWQRCALGQTFSQGRCLAPEKQQVKSWFSWQDAVSEARKLSATSAYEGWRLPSVQELRSLVYRRCTDPAINTQVFPDAPAWHFWTASEVEDNPAYAWQVDFASGETNAHLKSNVSYHVRLVKGELLPTARDRAASASAARSSASAWDDGIHDTDNPDIQLLQHPDKVLEGMPRDTRSEPDWVPMLEQGLINPRASLEGEGEMVVWDQDIVLTDTASMPHVRFPHGTHSRWLACENCHDAIFPARRGQVDISMESIYKGRHCGVCHGTVAFSPHSCERCHSVIPEGSDFQKWW